MTVKAQRKTRPGSSVQARCGFITEGRFHPLATLVILGLCLTCSVGCKAPAKDSKVTPEQPQPSVQTADRFKTDPRSEESKSVDPDVQSELRRMEAEKRATLLMDAQSAFEETRNAFDALDKGDKQAALAALARATGKLDLVVARDPKMALAPVSVATTVIDLYTTPDTVKGVVKQAKDDLSNEQVQQARLLVQNLASEADIHVTEIPLATYPSAIKAIAPLVDAGKTEEAKAALFAALSTLVIETYVVPLPKVRAEAMLKTAETLAKKGRQQRRGQGETAQSH